MSPTPLFSQPAFARLQQAYADRLSAARSVHERGGAVVGVVGNTVPVELILAIGAFPLQIAGEARHPTPAADRLIETTEPWPMRSMANRLLDGTCAFLDLLVVTRPEEWLYYNLKEAVRIGAGAAVPPLHIHDLIQNHGPNVSRYNDAQTRYLVERLERLNRGPIAPDQILEATRLTNRRRGVLRDVQALRDHGRLSSVEAMTIMGAANFLHPAIYCDLLESALRSVPPADPNSTSPRVIVVPSEPLFHLKLHRTLEAAGLDVVAEDTWWGSRSAGPDIPLQGDPLENVHRASIVDTQGEDVQPREAREAWLRARIERGDLSGVIFYLPADKRFGWAVPRLRKRMDELGLPSIILSHDVLDPAGRAVISTAAAEFAATLRPRALAGADA